MRRPPALLGATIPVALLLVGFPACSGDGDGETAATDAQDPPSDGGVADAPGPGDGSSVGTGEETLPSSDASGALAPSELLPLAVVHILCGQAATTVISDCARGLLPGTIEDFEAECISRSEADPWWLASYWCFAESCQLEACRMAEGAPEPFGPAAGCAPLCAAVDGCDALEFFELPEDEPGACEITCAGALVAAPELEAAIGCTTGAMEAGCNIPAAGACLQATGDPADPILNLLIGQWEEVAVQRGGGPEEEAAPGSWAIFQNDLSYLSACGAFPSGTWELSAASMTITIQYSGAGAVQWTVELLDEESLVLQQGADLHHYQRGACDG